MWYNVCAEDMRQSRIKSGFRTCVFSKHSIFRRPLFILGDTMKQIQLSKGKVAIVDDDDYEYISQWKWHAHFNAILRTWSAIRKEKGENGKYRQVFMHNKIMNAPDGFEVDHINHDRLDNRRSNLRICTHKENTFNRRSQNKSRSKYKGVAWHKHNKMWQANITVDGKQIPLGYFKNEIDAAKAYDMASKKYQGDFAFLNFPNA